MTPLPKRKHSTQRSGKRKKSKIKTLPKLIKCKNCGKRKKSHLICQYCGK